MSSSVRLDSLSSMSDSGRWTCQSAARDCSRAGTSHCSSTESAGMYWRTRSVAAPSHKASIRTEEHTSELQSLMRISYAVFCLKKKKHNTTIQSTIHIET